MCGGVSYASANCGSEQFTVVFKFRLKFVEGMQINTTSKLQFDRLLKDSSCKGMHANRIKTKYNSLEGNSKSNTLNKAIVTLAKGSSSRKRGKKVKEVDDIKDEKND